MTAAVFQESPQFNNRNFQLRLISSYPWFQTFQHLHMYLFHGQFLIHREYEKIFIIFSRNTYMESLSHRALPSLTLCSLSHIFQSQPNRNPSLSTRMQKFKNLLNLVNWLLTVFNNLARWLNLHAGCWKIEFLLLAGLNEQFVFFTSAGFA